MKWHLKENYTKISNGILPEFCGTGLKTLLVSVYLIVWGTILLVTFSLLN